MDNLIEMYWLDLAIIYFAFGAPFGVFQITAKREITLSSFFRIASGYLLWPLLAIQSVAQFVFTKPTEHKDELESIRIEFEKITLANVTANELYAFREVFYRYTGLAQTADETPHPLNNAPLLNIANHAHRNVRNACLVRTDRQKLNIQLSIARQDFAEMTISTKTKSIGWALANYFEDKALADSIHSR